MAAITWRNVDAPSFGDSARTLGMAGDSFNNMFGVLNKQLEKQQALGEQNWQNQASNNTDAFMGEMRRRYTTPEAYAAAQASGEVDALRSQFGAQINRVAAQELMTKMPERLQRTALTNQAYEMNQEDFGSREIRGMALSKAANGDVPGALGIANGSEVPERFRAQLLSDILTVSQQQQLFDAKMATEKGQQSLNTANINRLNAEAQGAAPKPADILKITEQRKQPVQQAQSSNIFGGAAYDSPEGQKANTATLDSTGTFMGYGSSAAYTGKVIEQLKDDGIVSKDGKSFVYRIGDREVTVPVTAAILDQVIKADDTGWSSPRVGSTADKLKALIRSPEMVDAAVAYHNNKATLDRLDDEALSAVATGTTAGMKPFDRDDPTGLATTMANYRQRQIDQAAAKKAKQDQRLQDAIDARKQGMQAGALKPSTTVAPALQAEQEKALRDAQAAQRNMNAPLLGMQNGGYANFAVPGARVEDPKKKSEGSVTPKPITASEVPKGDTPVPGVIAGSPEVPASNTRSFTLNPESGKQKPTQPLQLPPDTVFTNTRQFSRSEVQQKADFMAKKYPQGATIVLSAPTVKGKSKIPDGDGFEIGDLECRLDLIDAPEVRKDFDPKKYPGQPYGNESKKSLEQMVQDKEVNITISEAATKNSYARSICKIEVEGQNLSVAQLRKGLAWLYKEAGIDQQLVAMTRNNKANGVGLFADPNAEHPGKYRADRRSSRY